MRLEPVFDNIVVEPAKGPSKSSSGKIHLPDDAMSIRPNEGIVTAVGPGKMASGFFKLREGLNPMLHEISVGDFVPVMAEGPPVKEGDHILFKGYTGAQVSVDGSTQYVVAFRDVLAIVHDSEGSVGNSETLGELVTGSL